MSELFLIFVVALVAFYWYSSAKCKEIAVAAARKECKFNEVQLLDQTVQQVRISMSRDKNDNWRVWRHYRFDFSVEGDDRRGGEVILLGHNVISTYVSLPPVH
jgi:hypothetical protein